MLLQERREREINGKEEEKINQNLIDVLGLREEKKIMCDCCCLQHKGKQPKIAFMIINYDKNSIGTTTTKKIAIFFRPFSISKL